MMCAGRMHSRDHRGQSTAEAMSGENKPGARDGPETGGRKERRTARAEENDFARRKREGRYAKGIRLEDEKYAAIM